MAIRTPYPSLESPRSSLGRLLESGADHPSRKCSRRAGPVPDI